MACFVGACKDTTLHTSIAELQALLVILLREYQDAHLLSNNVTHSRSHVRVSNCKAKTAIRDLMGKLHPSSCESSHKFSSNHTYLVKDQLGPESSEG